MKSRLVRILLLVVLGGGVVYPALGIDLNSSTSTEVTTITDYAADFAVAKDGDMHVVERIHLTGPDTLHVDMEITASKVFTRPWKTTREFLRRRGQVYDIVEGQCVQGELTEAVDENGNMIFKRTPTTEDGSVVLAPQ